MSYDDCLNINGDKQISDYILHDEIGSGGFAKVVEGIHIPTGEKVAIKIMDKIELFTDPLNLRRVKTEISLLKIVRHKNIIKLYEVIETPQKIYLIMEYCEGGELFDYIVKKQHLTEKQSCIFFHEIIDALEYLHSLNIVHRDLKPENLLIDKINKRLSLKLIDFGISNTYDLQSLLMTPCGTASYAPPEMHKGEKYYGLLTDIWSAGVVLYAMVFGYLPFCDDDEDTNINNIIEGNYEIPSSASPELYDLLLHILDINPLTRYDIDQIKMHPWYNLVSSDNNRPGIIIGYHKIPVDERIINICESYGYDINKVRESVINNNYDNNSSIYYIILNKMKTMGVESISDLNSKEYLNYISDPNNIFFNKNNFNNKANYEKEKDMNLKNEANSNKNIIKNNSQKYDNKITPSSNIQFTINSHLKMKNINFDKLNKKGKNHIKYKDKKKNVLHNKKNFNNNIYYKKNKQSNSSSKNKNINKRIISSNKKIKLNRKLINMSQIIKASSIENIKKKQDTQEPTKIDNNLIFQTNKTFSIICKYNINNNDKNINEKIKKNESFNKKLTDDIKEKILKLRNPKINTRKQKINEAKLKLQLKIKKNNKNNYHKKKIRLKMSILKDRKKHTIIHNRNASATPNRYNRHKNNNHININYINNNININNIYIQKIREQSTSPPRKNINNNSSIIKYQKKNKNKHNNLNYNNKNNISIISKNTIDNLESTIHDNSTINKSSKKINYKNKINCIKTKLSGRRNNFKKLLKNIDNEIRCKSARNRNISLTNRGKQKDAPPSIHFLSFLNKNNKSSAKKRLNNQSNLHLKKSYINDLNKINNLFHTSFNYNYRLLKNEYNNIKKEKEKEKNRDNNKILNDAKNNNVKKNIYKNEIKEKCSFINKSNQLVNCISPIHKKNKKIFDISNKKNKNKYKNISISIALNTTRSINHKKCSSMKYIENTSDSLNYDFNPTEKTNINNNNLNKSYREREIKREIGKEKSTNKNIILLSHKKSCNKKKIIKIMNLSFKNKDNKERNNNYKSNYVLKKNIIFPKKYYGPIDFRNIVIALSGIDICDEIENILKKKNINLHRIHQYKIICWKNIETIEINIYLLSGNIINNKNSIKMLDLDSNDLEIKYNNTYTGFYKKGEMNVENISINNKFSKKVKNNLFYINILSQKEKKGNNKSLFELINKLIYNRYYLVKK